MNDAPTLSNAPMSLEAKMSQELDYIVIKSRLYSMAEADMAHRRTLRRSWRRIRTREC